MSLQIERQLTIQTLIKKSQTVRIDELASRLRVSPNTIRRDLAILEQQGVLKRTQGGAVLPDAQTPMRQPFEQRSRSYSAEKEAIGRYAATLVEPGSTIILDAGTTTQQLANHLHEIEELTVATNSLEIAYSLTSSPNITLIVSGGIFIESTRSLTGLPAEHFFSQIHAAQLFLGARGVSIEDGLTNANMYETPIKKQMIQVAKEIILLADHSKFGKVTLSPFASLSSIHKIITDWRTPQETIQEIEALGITVVVVEDGSEFRL